MQAMPPEMPSEVAPDLAAGDARARREALDPARSFIVQAPAGSGKTELLIQRHLALLATCEEPESVVALTFTLKAAGEMRERLQNALANAREGTETGSAHARLTRELALAVVERDRRLDWQLELHPSRLRVMTLDALALWLAGRAPLASGLAGEVGLVDDARELYLEAARAALDEAAAEDAHWQALLAHADNDAELVVGRLAELLAKREQWIHAFGGGALRERFDAALRGEAIEVLQALAVAIPAGAGLSLASALQPAVDALCSSAPDHPSLPALAALVERGGWPPVDADALPEWALLADYLLTGSGAFRVAYATAQGFENASGPQAARRREQKASMKALAEALRAVPGLAERFDDVRLLSAPVQEAAWRMVEALIEVLKRCAAQLMLVFARRREMDFVEANRAAMQALGEEGEPSELMLRLDYAVRHLLVDEFQDTSLAQLRLLERLTSGWEPDDGRTLFVVGDPMQSIYGFREANVGVFLEAQRSGRINHVQVTPLALSRNFRSHGGLVEWTNRVFAQVLAASEDPVHGRVRHVPALPGSGRAGEAPCLSLVESEDAEAAHVVACVHQARAAGAASIAILVRRRNDLARILPALARERLACTAVEVDLVSDRQVVADLRTLTYALTQPADRLSWLALLRAPWCGLLLPDLDRVAALPALARQSPLTAALDLVDLAPLSDDGRARLAAFLARLRPAFEGRGRRPLAERVRAAWLAIGGPALAVDETDLDAAERFFGALSECESDDDLPERGALEARLAALHANGGTEPDAVQVMTIHKAKGLEFDAVILPGLAFDRAPAGEEGLRWLGTRHGLLAAAPAAKGETKAPLHEYLRRVSAASQMAELDRLLYVACTRARSRLDLVGVLEAERPPDAMPQWKAPGSRSALARLWAALASDRAAPGEPLAFAAAGAAPATPALRRLPAGWPAPPLPPPLPFEPARAIDRSELPSYDWAAESARTIGTLSHRLLARVAADGIATWSSSRVDTERERLVAELASLGFAPAEANQARDRIVEAVSATLADERGRWLFDPGHAEAHSEWALCGVEEGTVVRVVLDRTFVDGGERWIVDFKTGRHEGGDTTAFLDREVERYAAQLERYGRIAAALDGRPVRLALYYPLVPGGFRELKAR